VKRGLAAFSLTLLRLEKRTTQVVTVNRTRSWHAQVTFWQRTSTGWRAVLRAPDGRIGYGGLVVGTRPEAGTGNDAAGHVPAAELVRHARAIGR